MLTSGIDELDARILSVPPPSRGGIIEAPRRLSGACGTVQARLAKLEQPGIARGSGPEVDPARMGALSRQIRCGAALLLEAAPSG